MVKEEDKVHRRKRRTRKRRRRRGRELQLPLLLLPPPLQSLLNNNSNKRKCNNSVNSKNKEPHNNNFNLPKLPLQFNNRTFLPLVPQLLPVLTLPPLSLNPIRTLTLQYFEQLQLLLTFNSNNSNKFPSRMVRTRTRKLDLLPNEIRFEISG